MPIASHYAPETYTPKHRKYKHRADVPPDTSFTPEDYRPRHAKPAVSFLFGRLYV